MNQVSAERAAAAIRLWPCAALPLGTTPSGTDHGTTCAWALNSISPPVCHVGLHADIAAQIAELRAGFKRHGQDVDGLALVVGVAYLQLTVGAG